jgi:hypothetical protein
MTNTLNSDNHCMNVVIMVIYVILIKNSNLIYYALNEKKSHCFIN